MEILDSTTPLSAPPRYEGFLIRFAAYIIDAIIIGIVNYSLMFIFFGSMFPGMALGKYEPGQMNLGKMGLFYLFMMVLQWLYYALMESSAKQGTVGKMAVGIIVTDMDGNKIAFGTATGRFFAKFLSAIILMIGYLMVIWDKKKQGLHDRIAGTLVVKRSN